MSHNVICGYAAPWEPVEAPEDWIPCCMGSAMNGPQGCNCWEAVFDLEQTGPQIGVMPLLQDECDVRDRACVDCAYKPDSPERNDDRAEHLLGLPQSGAVFFCHQGIRRALEYRHPDGRVHVGDPGDYQPPIVGAVPYKADGSAADICAGWAARRSA